MINDQYRNYILNNCKQIVTATTKGLGDNARSDWL